MVSCRSLSTLLTSLWVLLSAQVSWALPSLILAEGETKCVLFEAAMDDTLKIDYKAPDLILDQVDPGFNPAYITVNIFPSNRVIDGKHAPVKSHLKPTTKMLDSSEGRIKHTFEVDGEANICFKAPQKPKGRHNHNEKVMFKFEYHISLVDGLDGEDDEDFLKGKKVDVDSHLSHMEKELTRVHQGLQTILREADLAKTREAQFHKQTESMHSATMFWPIVQVSILLMTGFTQANHIVQFFKQRRII